MGRVSSSRARRRSPVHWITSSATSSRGDDAEIAEILSLLKSVAVGLRLQDYNILQSNGDLMPKTPSAA